MNEVMEMRVWNLQEEVAKLPQVELPTEHFFADGMYARSVKRPAGTVIVGKVHKREHFYIVTKGKVSVFSGTTTKVYESGDIVVSQPGTKRAVYALEDSICMTVHRTDKTDIEEIEKELVEEDSSALFDSLNRLKDREDYLRVLEETGFTAEERRRISENPLDQIPMPEGFSVTVKPSPIEGLGVFSNKDFKQGELIAPARIGAKRTPAGRYTNHSMTPNAEAEIYLVAKENIKSGEEITLNYRQAKAEAEKCPG
jgi:quercetin dioxygenase-like cupin family protein